MKINENSRVQSVPKLLLLKGKIFIENYCKQILRLFRDYGHVDFLHIVTQVPDSDMYFHQVPFTTNSVTFEHLPAMSFSSFY